MVHLPPPDAEDPGNLIDPEVLATRRAARERPALEERLRAVEGERDALRATARQAERELRTVRQREEAERRVRVETEDDAAAARRVASEELRRLRRDLAAAERQALELAGELERVRREAEHELAARLSDAQRAEADAARLEAELELAVDGAASERVLLHAELDRVRAALSEALDEQHALGAALAAAQAERDRVAEALAEAEADRDVARAALTAAEERHAARLDGAQEARDERDRLAGAAREALDGRAALDAQLAGLTAERDLLAARVDELVAEREARVRAAAAPEAADDGSVEAPRPFALVDPVAARALREKLDGLAAVVSAAEPRAVIAHDLAAAARRLRESSRPAAAPAARAGRETAGRPWLRDALAALAAHDRRASEALARALVPFPEPGLLGRRRARRQRRVMLEAPVSLAELARSGVVPEPGLLLRALALLVDPSWPRTAAVVRVDSGGRWLLDAAPGLGLRFAADRGTAAVAATLAVEPAGLLGALAGLPPASGAKPRVTGSHAAVAQLLDLVDRAQR